MSLTDRGASIGAPSYWLRSALARYTFSVLLVLAATITRYVIVRNVAPLPPFILFFPTILIIALVAGMGPGLLATLLSAVSVVAFFWNSLGVFGESNLRQSVSLTIFIAIGTGFSKLADLFLRHQMRLVEFARVMEGVEERIAVIDREYRYLTANGAFFRQKRLKKEQVIGRRVSEVLDPEIFENQVRPKLDECFRGKVVQFEMSLRDPELGEKQLAITYFPISGRNGIDRAGCILRDVTQQRKATHSLQLFRTLIDESNDAVEVLDPESFRFLDVNAKSCRDLGYAREEMLAMTVFDIDPQADHAYAQDILKELRSVGSLVQQTTHRRKDGSTFPVEASLRLVQLDRAYIVAVTRDITRRKQAEEALLASEDRYRDLVEHIEDLLCTHDLQGRLLSVNPAPARALGYEVNELLRMSMRDLIAPEFRDRFEEYLKRMRDNRTDQGMICVVTRGGERRMWEYRNTLRMEGVEEPIVRGLAHDVTERMKAEAALRNSEKRYRLLFEKNVACVATCNEKGEIADCNEAWARMLGFDTPAELRGRQTAEFYFDPFDREPLMLELRREGRLASRELRMRRKDGGTVWVLFDCSVHDGEDGRSMTQATAIDITPRKISEESLRRREEDYRQFVARSSEGIFSDDFDEPLPIDLPEDVLIRRMIQESYIAECNDAFAEMYGFESRQKALGRRTSDLLVPEDPRNLEMKRRFIHSGFRLLDYESHEVDVRGNAKVFSNSMIGIVEDGKLVRTWGIQRDVTERKRAEELLKRSEQEIRLFIEHAPAALAMFDCEMRYIKASRRWCADYKVDEQSLVGKSHYELFPEVPERWKEVHRRALAGEVVREENDRFDRLDGSVQWVRWEVRPWYGSAGKVGGIVIFAEEVTERKQAEDALRQSDQRFRMALTGSPITVFNQDQDLRYTWIYNPQLYWQQDVIGKTDDEILGPKKAARLKELKSHVLKTGKAVREEVMIPQNSGRYAFDMMIEPLFDTDRNVVGITAACMDIARLRLIADGLQDAKEQLAREKSYLESEIQTELGFEQIIGQSPALREVLRKAKIVAPTDSSVLVLGETGTGKELVARSIHALSARREKTFVKLNCAAVPSGLLESELFGHEKGAFTGAVSQKIGRIELADKGTLFLDEIGELPLELQPKLLRVLQDREFERLGGVRTLHVDVRIISATNRDLQREIQDRKFREDLFYRLNVFPIELPPLRDRAEDISVLVHHFVDKHASRMGKRILTIPDDTMRVLQTWSWPGNVRELENMIERMVILSKGLVLAPPPAELQLAPAGNEDDLTEMEREHIIRILRETNGMVSGAANRLGMKRTTLQSMLKRLGIEPHEYRHATGPLGQQ